MSNLFNSISTSLESLLILFFSFKILFKLKSLIYSNCFFEDFLNFFFILISLICLTIGFLTLFLNLKESTSLLYLSNGSFKLDLK